MQLLFSPFIGDLQRNLVVGSLSSPVGWGHKFHSNATGFCWPEHIILGYASTGLSTCLCRSLSICLQVATLCTFTCSCMDTLNISCSKLFNVSGHSAVHTHTHTTHHTPHTHTHIEGDPVLHTSPHTTMGKQTHSPKST